MYFISNISFIIKLINDTLRSRDILNHKINANVTLSSKCNHEIIRSD